MLPSFPIGQRVLLLFMTLAGGLLSLDASAVSCVTQSQMTMAQRDALSIAAGALASEVRSGDVQTLRQNTILAVAADFGGIADSVYSVKPLLQQAVITIDSLYALDASTEPADTPRTDFYCGTPLVVLNFAKSSPFNPMPIVGVSRACNLLKITASLT